MLPLPPSVGSTGAIVNPIILNSSNYKFLFKFILLINNIMLMTVVARAKGTRARAPFKILQKKRTFKLNSNIRSNNYYSRSRCNRHLSNKKMLTDATFQAINCAIRFLIFVHVRRAQNIHCATIYCIKIVRTNYTAVPELNFYLGIILSAGLGLIVILFM